MLEPLSQLLDELLKLIQVDFFTRLVLEDLSHLELLLSCHAVGSNYWVLNRFYHPSPSLVLKVLNQGHKNIY
jgi:hypothetical protein